jgi:hypothetical protein
MGSSCLVLDASRTRVPDQCRTTSPVRGFCDGQRRGTATRPCLRLYRRLAISFRSTHASGPAVLGVSAETASACANRPALRAVLACSSLTTVSSWPSSGRLCGTTLLTVLRGRGRTWLGMRHRSEPPIGWCRMRCGGARLMLQAAKQAAPPPSTDLHLPGPGAPGRASWRSHHVSAIDAGARPGDQLSIQLSNQVMSWRPCRWRSCRSGRLSIGPSSRRLVSMFPTWPTPSTLPDRLCEHAVGSDRPGGGSCHGHGGGTLDVESAERDAFTDAGRRALEGCADALRGLFTEAGS